MNMKRTFSTTLHPNNLQDIQRASHRHMWRGVPMWKNPFDFALYWMLVWQAKPRTIIELGSKYGGSAVWFADMLEIYGIKGRVVSVDIAPVRNINDPRIDFLEGDVNDLGIAAQFNGGPNRAVLEFFSKHPSEYALVTEFCDFWGKNVTWNPNGYWRKLV